MTVVYTTLRYHLRFNSPAFLGNAEQAAQWRTPPIKALLRQWWRVAYVADHRQGASVAAMRSAERKLFGVAADGTEDSTRSLVRLRLSTWSAGKLTSWDRLEQPSVHHDEVERTRYKVGPHSYLGFGPLDGKNGTHFSEKTKAAIQVGERAEIAIATCASSEIMRLQRTLSLMHLYGTLGGRSRNGWGSLSLTPADAASPELSEELDKTLVRPWRDALSHDWAQAIGSDEHGPLIWRTEALNDWKAVMRRLAEIKIGLRTQFRFKSGNVATPEERHWLSYPVTNHSVHSWGNNARLPNSLRFKVRPDAGGQWHGVIFHVPCQPPAVFKPNRSTLLQVWQRVHQHLDQVANLQRLPA